MKLLSILLFSSVLFAPFGLHAAMNGGNFEIYADTFSVVQDQLITNGGTFTITNTGGESSAQTLGGNVTGSISNILGGMNLMWGEIVIGDGVRFTTFTFRNRAGGQTGNIESGTVTIDTGGMGSMDSNTMTDRIAEAINNVNANLKIQATSNGTDSVSLVNTRTSGVDGNVVITETVADGGFSVSGMSGGNSSTGYKLQGGFQAMERSSLSMSLNSNTIALGALSLDSVSSGSVVLNVTTDSTTGYTTSVTEDGNLRKGAGGDNDDINDVSDGSVTAGSEEYGIATTGDGGLLIPDTALNGEVAVAASNDEVTSQQTTIAFKAAIARTSRAGSYSHVVTFSSTANP